MSTAVLEYALPAPTRLRRAIGLCESLVLAGAAIGLPLLCLALSARRYPGAPEFQRGHWNDYLTLLPSGRAVWPFVPLLFAAMFAMGVTLIRPERTARSWVLRYAVYSGVVLSAQFTLIQMIALFDPSAWMTWEMLGAVVATIITTALAAGMIWATKFLGYIKPVVWVPSLIFLAIAAVLFHQQAIMVVLLTAMAIALIAPALTLAAYLRAANLVRKLAREQSTPQRRVFIGFVWLATYGLAWILAMINAIELYRSLPIKPPDC
jgi:hypothetical protein